MIDRREFVAMMGGAAVQAKGGKQAPATTAAAEADWPQWRGPNRDGISTETGLLAQWPSGGPKVVWSQKGLGSGYGSMSVAGPHIYVQGAIGGQSFVHALNRADGKPVWKVPMGEMLEERRGPGPRGTPTVDSDRVYVLSEAGDLACLRVKDGSAVWKKNILRDFGGSTPHWRISESPLGDGAHLRVTPGGRGNGVVALNKIDLGDPKTLKLSSNLGSPVRLLCRSAAPLVFFDEFVDPLLERFASLPLIGKLDLIRRFSFLFLDACVLV